MSGTLIVGEAYGELEAAWEAPFVGPSGIELTEELGDAGFLTSEDVATVCRGLYAARNGTLRPSIAVSQRDRIFQRRGITLANCASARPPDNKIERWFYTKTEAKRAAVPPLHLRYPNETLRAGITALEGHISRTHPSLIIVLGGTPLWALTGRDGITRWRSSQLVYSCADGHSAALVPTLHPAAVLRDWPWRPIVVHDLKRALHVRENSPKHPEWDFTIRPDLDTVLGTLDDLSRESDKPLVADTETIGGHITCIGFADSPRRAICIPFLDPGAADGSANYWPTCESEMRILRSIQRLLANRPIVFHNGLYDYQVIQNDWGFVPNWTDDTMVAQHVAFPGLFGGGIDPVTGATSKRGSSLSLAFCASMYCQHYIFWKDDGRLWNPNTMPPEQHWRYNCEDCIRTFEVNTALQNILHQAGLLEQYHFQCQRLGLATLRIMRRGLRLDGDLRKRQLASVHDDLKNIEAWFSRVLGHPLNPQSNPQMKALFYADLHCPVQYTGKGQDKRVSCDDEALAAIRRSRTELAPLIKRCQDYRTLAVLGGKARAANKSLLTCRLSNDNRFRFTLNLCGAETFRYSGGPNAFGEGCNPQNIAKERK